MKKRLGTAVVCALAVGLTSDAWSQNETPMSMSGVIFEPYAFTGFDAREEVINTLDSTSGQHYRYEKEIQWEVGLNPTVTLGDFGLHLQRGHGVFFLATHGGTSSTRGWAIEVYDTTQEARQVSYEAYEEYISSGDWDESEIYWGRGTNRYFRIGAMPGAIESRFTSAGTIVYDASCNSFDRKDSWIGAREFLGYTYPVDIELLTQNATDFWNLLNGEMGSEYRVVANAANHPYVYYALDYDEQSSAGNTVLAPAVHSVHPTNGMTLERSGFHICTVDLDCLMDNAVSGLLFPTGCSVGNPVWLDGSTLEFWVWPPEDENGWGYIEIEPEVARSAANSAMLDGSLDPEETNGHGPNGDPYVVAYYFTDNPAASLESFGVDRNEVAWRATEEDCTEAFRLLGSNGPGDEWVVVSDEIPAEGARFEYRVSVPAGWDYLKLQEKEQRYSGTRWIDHDICLADPPAEDSGEERRTRPRWLRVVGVEENIAAIEAFLARMAECGIGGDYEIVSAITPPIVEDILSAASSKDTLRVIWPHPDAPEGGRGNIERFVGIVGPSEYEEPLNAYAAQLSQHSPPGVNYMVSVCLVDPPYDSSVVHSIVTDSLSLCDYALLFGWVCGPNQSPETTMPCPYLSDPGDPVGVGPRFSLWGWECGSLDTSRVETCMGYVPVTDSTDVREYLWKMMDYGWNQPWVDYGCRVGAWTYDLDYSGRSGAYVRSQMAGVIDQASSAGWEVDSLWASAVPYTERADSAVSALTAGRSLVMVMGTIGRYYDLCKWMACQRSPKCGH